MADGLSKIHSSGHCRERIITPVCNGEARGKSQGEARERPGRGQGEARGKPGGEVREATSKQRRWKRVEPMTRSAKGNPGFWQKRFDGRASFLLLALGIPI
jgi:hypothetical protein